MANRELSRAEWLDKAEAYCARAEHCLADVKRKLYEWGAPADIYDFIEKKLYENDFINDSRFCHAFAHDKLEYQQWGKIKIHAALQALQLPEEDISDALDAIEEDHYLEILKALVQREKKNGKDGEKLLRFLLQRGFSYQDIKKCK